MVFDPIHDTLGTLRAKATELREVFGDEARARTLDWAATQLRDALQVAESRPLTLRQAAAHSGYSIDHLGLLLRRAKLPNAGRKGHPRIRAADLPNRDTCSVAGKRKNRYDPRADARMLTTRRQ